MEPRIIVPYKIIRRSKPRTHRSLHLCGDPEEEASLDRMFTEPRENPKIRGMLGLLKQGIILQEWKG